MLEPSEILPAVAPSIPITIAAAAVLAILIALPTALLASTLEQNEGRIARFLRARLPRRTTGEGRGRRP